MSYVEVTFAVGEFDLILRHDWDTDEDDDDGKVISLGVQSPDMDQRLLMTFSTVDELRDFARLVTRLAERDFEHGREVVLRRDGSVNLDRVRG